MKSFILAVCLMASALSLSACYAGIGPHGGGIGVGEHEHRGYH